MQKVQSICVFCRKPFKRLDLVQVDKVFDHFTHHLCYDLEKHDIKELGMYGDIVSKNKKYRNMYIIQD